MPILPQTDLFRTSILIGVADVFMITLFMLVCCVGMRMHFMDILVQFLFPMVVAAGICFAMLNSRALNEAASMFGCFCGA